MGPRRTLSGSTSGLSSRVSLVFSAVLVSPCPLRVDDLLPELTDRLQSLHDYLFVILHQHLHLWLHLHHAHHPQAAGIHGGQRSAHDHPHVRACPVTGLDSTIDFSLTIQLRCSVCFNIRHRTPVGPHTEALASHHHWPDHRAGRSCLALRPAERPPRGGAILWLCSLHERRLLRLPGHSILGL